jgi:hypothetical protein
MLSVWMPVLLWAHRIELHRTSRPWNMGGAESKKREVVSIESQEIEVIGYKET